MESAGLVKVRGYRRFRGRIGFMIGLSQGLGRVYGAWGVMGFRGLRAQG